MAARVTAADALRVSVFGVSDVGLVRTVNEDAFAMADLNAGERWTGRAPRTWSSVPNGVLVEVSDGMGGARAGEVASALSVEGVAAGMISACLSGPPDGETLRSVIEHVNRKVHRAAQRPDRRGMGATMTAALIQRRCAYIAQIGDSRAYLIRDGRIGQVTHDQSYVQMLVDAGVMTPEEAERSPRRNIILQVMGQEHVKVALGRIDVRPGDRLLFCSDGLTTVVDDETIRAVARPPKDIADAALELVRLTKLEGAPDNVTVVLAQLDA